MTKPPNAAHEPYQAAQWLVSRHDHAQHLVERLGVWCEDSDSLPDLDMIAEGINAADQYGVEWKAYEEAHSPPRASSYADDHAYERAYDRWEHAGPKVSNPFAAAYLPMSSGEKRLFRMLATLDPHHRVRFHLDDTNGVSLRCCWPGGGPGAGPVHPTFGTDWAQLIAGAVT